MQERELAKLREVFQRAKDEKETLSGEVAICRNQLSAFATDLNNKRSSVASTNIILAEKMQRLDAAKKKYAATQDRLNKELSA
jgi:chromosome segregation ATPase